MNSPSQKEFKAVDFMRKKREALSNLYNTNPSKFLKELEEVRKNYSKKFGKLKKQIVWELYFKCNSTFLKT